MLRQALSRASVVAAAGVIAGGLLADQAAAQTIRMWTFLDPAGKSGREVALKEMIDTFEAQNPGVRVQVEPQVWQQLSDKFMASHQTGTAPDIIWLVVRRLGGAIDMGAVADLNELIFKNWSAEEVADIDGPYHQYKAEDGKHFHITGSRSVFGMCYRADLLKEAGIDPESLKSWDNFIAAAQKLQQADANGNVVRWGFAQSFASHGASATLGLDTIAHLNGSIFHEDGRAAWANEAGVRGLQLYLDMVGDKYRITPTQAVSLSSDDVYDQFTAGRAVFARCSSARVPRLAEALGGPEKVSFMGTPSFAGGEYAPTESAGWSIAVWSRSRNLELAAKFVEHMSSREADELWVKKGGQPPIRHSTIENNPEFFADPQNQYLAALAEVMATAAWFPQDNAGEGWNERYYEAVQDAVVNKTPPIGALKKAEDAYNRSNRLN